MGLIRELFDGGSGGLDWVSAVDNTFCPGSNTDSSCGRLEASPPHPGLASWAAGLSDAEREAVTAWTDKRGKELRKRFAEGGTDEALVSALEKAPVHAGTVYRGLSRSVADKILAAGVGGTWQDMAPMSMTRDPAKASGFSSGGVMLRIRSRTGRAVESASASPNEKEVVGLPGIKYRVAGIQHNAPISYDSAYGPVKEKYKLLVDLEEEV